MGSRCFYPHLTGKTTESQQCSCKQNIPKVPAPCPINKISASVASVSESRYDFTHRAISDERRIMIKCKKNVLVQILFYWMGSEQEHRGPEHSLKTVTIKTGNSICCLAIHHWVWLCNPSFSWAICVRKYSLWVRVSVFLVFEALIQPIFCRPTLNFLTVSVFCLTLLLIVLRSCHFIDTVTITLLLTHSKCKALTSFFHPWCDANISTMKVMATWLIETYILLFNLMVLVSWIDFCIGK